MTKPMTAEKLKRLVRISHERQFNGEDYQTVAIDVATEHGVDYESDEFTELMSSPDPGCECGFCAKAYEKADKLWD